MAYSSTDKIIGVMTEYKKNLDSNTSNSLISIDQKQFVLLLSAVSSCRKWQPTGKPLGFTDFYKCETPEEKEQVASWLEAHFKVEDWVTLESACNRNYNIHDEYKQFWAEWHRISTFNIKSADPAYMFKLKRCNQYARMYSDLLDERGFFAWDCNERIGLCRLALACDIITEEEFWFAVLPYAKKASRMYTSWNEYCISYLAGYIYHTYQQRNCSEELIPQFKVGFGIIQYLMDNHWQNSAWFVFPDVDAINKKDMKHMIDWDGPDLCIATKRITVDGYPVGYMYREAPDTNFNDSGWRFYQGAEDDDYAYDLSNSGLHSLNDICNYDPAIIPYLDMPVGTGLKRVGGNKFIEVNEQMQ